MAVYAKAARGEDEPSALAGLGLIEDGESLIQALQAKSWLAGSLAGLGGALDMADLARDPFGTAVVGVGVGDRAFLAFEGLAQRSDGQSRRGPRLFPDVVLDRGQPE